MTAFVKTLIDDDSQGKAFNTYVKQAGYAFRRVDLQELADR